MIARWIPTAGRALVLALVIVDLALGLLPVVFILATSFVVGRVPSVLRGGPGDPAIGELTSGFLLATVAFLVQQCLAPVQGVLGERMRRRVDGNLRDETIAITQRSTGMASMEDGETLNALNEVLRLLDLGWNTPGMACAGMLALIARYVRLVGLLVILGTVAAWPAAGAVGAAVMLLRHGQRGGLRKYSRVWREVADVNRRARYLRELAMGFDAAKEMRIFGLVDWMSERYASSYVKAFSQVAARRRQVYLAPYLVYTPVVLCVSAAVLATLGRGAANSSISLGELALALQATVGALLLGEFYPECDVPTQFGMQALVALEELRKRAERFEVAPMPRASVRVEPELPARTLCFENVSFRYPSAERSVLDGLSLDLAVGRCTALVGVNGAGKTTLVKLLTRLYEPTEGCIRADGRNIADFDPIAWRRQVGVIFQDFIRYELSLADNVALGAAHVPRDLARVKQALAQVGLLDVCERLPRGFDTPLARAYEDGVELSGGQWQRISIARSLYALSCGARVLVLDEPTSALDVRAEADFFNRFAELTRGRTSVLISHRFSSVRRADHIIVIDGGRVVEQGCHAELMALGGQYAHLFRLQARRFTTAAPPGGDESGELDTSQGAEAPGLGAA